MQELNKIQVRSRSVGSFFMVQLHQCTTVWCELDILASFSFWTSLVSAGKIIPTAMLLIYYPMFPELILETSA